MQHLYLIWYEMIMLHIYIYVFICICICIYICICICICVRVRVCLCICLCICKYVQTLCIYICTYIYGYKCESEVISPIMYWCLVLKWLSSVMTAHELRLQHGDTFFRCCSGLEPKGQVNAPLGVGSLRAELYGSVQWSVAYTLFAINMRIYVYLRIST